MKKDCRAWKERVGAANATEYIQDALILSVDSPLESWILDSGASFHSSPHQGEVQQGANGGKVISRGLGYCG
jgi:hypothetical protein